MIEITEYLKDITGVFEETMHTPPWTFVQHLETVLKQKLKTLENDYTINGEVAIHRSAVIEQHVIIKGPAIISANCFIGAGAYLRGGVFLGSNSRLGPGCEVKTSVILHNTALAHFNFIGDCLVGSNVNLEAGAIIANHFNERTDKQISVNIGDSIVETGVIKFGGIAGDMSRIGANAVLSPGTILKPGSIVKRLELVEQVRP